MSSLRKLKKKVKKINKVKMSQIIGNFASDIMAIGETLHQKQNYLNCACTAWNISLFPSDKFEEKVNEVVSEYEKNNKERSDSNRYRHNIEQLIEKKNKLYPNVGNTIIEAFVEEVNGKYVISVASINHKK